MNYELRTTNWPCSARPRRIRVIASLTWTGFVRSKSLYGLFLVVCVIIGSALFLEKFSICEELQMFKDISLGVISLFLNGIAVVATALLFSQDNEGQRLLTILAKPISRWEYLLGKLLGMFLFLFVSAVLMGALFLIVLCVREQVGIATMKHAMTFEAPQELEAASAMIKSTISIPALLAIFALMIMKSWLLASLTLLIATVATTPLFTMIMATAVYWIGHLQASVRELWLAEGVGNGWCYGVLALVTLFFPDLSAFNGGDYSAGGITISLFLSTLALGLIYVMSYYLLACFLFQRREFVSLN